MLWSKYIFTFKCHVVYRVFNHFILLSSKMHHSWHWTEQMLENDSIYTSSNIYLNAILNVRNTTQQAFILHALNHNGQVGA